MSTSTRFPDGQLCPACGAESDHATGKEGTTPRHGDLGMCIECAAFYTFRFENERLSSLVALTDDEVAALDPEMRRTMLIYQQALSRVRRP